MTDESVIKAEVGKAAERLPFAAVLLIAAGIFLLAVNFLHIHLGSFLWPGFFIIPGLLMLWPTYKSTAEDRSSWSFLAAPGAATVVFGGLLFLFNLTNHQESWLYAWTLLLAAGAAGYAYMHRFDPGGAKVERAHRFIRVVLLVFMAMAIFFELLVFQSLGGWWPVVLVGLGLYLLVKNKRSVA